MDDGQKRSSEVIRSLTNHGRLERDGRKMSPSVDVAVGLVNS